MAEALFTETECQEDDFVRCPRCKKAAQVVQHRFEVLTHIMAHYGKEEVEPGHLFALVLLVIRTYVRRLCTGAPTRS